MGFDVDVAKAVAKELGVQVEFQNYAFSGLIPALQASKIDMVIAGMTITDKRKEVVDFSNPYFVSGQALLVNKSVPNVKKPEDLDKKEFVIAVSMGTTADQTASRIFKNATVKKFEGSALAGLEVLNGKAQAVVHETPWVAIYQRMNPDKTRRRRKDRGSARRSILHQTHPRTDAALPQQDPDLIAMSTERVDQAESWRA